MRIGVMLRHVAQHPGGVRVYTRELVDALLRAGWHDHRLVLLYDDVEAAGRFDLRGRHEEAVLRVPSRLAWDQVAVPAAVRRYGLDVVFNPKYSLPLRCDVPGVFVCHGLDWYVMPWASRWTDRLSHRLLIPRYARAAAAVVAVSETARQDVLRFLELPAERVQTVHSGVADYFRAPVMVEDKARVRSELRLPERYFLYCGQVYPPKNFGHLIETFDRVGAELRIPLVVAGRHGQLCAGQVRDSRDRARHPWVHWVGWVDHRRMPALYAQAEGLLMPSLYEGFGFPVVEAMASGCPVVTSNRTACAELAGYAALQVDPEDPHALARAIRALARDASLRESLRAAGRQRATGFTWERCARETLRVIERAAETRWAQRHRSGLRARTGAAVAAVMRPAEPTLRSGGTSAALAADSAEQDAAPLGGH